MYGGWRQGQEMEQDVVDSAIPQDAGKCISDTGLAHG